MGAEEGCQAVGFQAAAAGKSLKSNPHTSQVVTFTTVVKCN